MDSLLQPKPRLVVHDSIYFNDGGELFDGDDVLPESFHSVAAFHERNQARFRRRGERLLAASRPIGGEHVWITDRLCHFYYHWICDALPRLERASEELGPSFSLLLPRRILDQPFVTPSLAPWSEIRIAGPPPAGEGGRADRLILPARQFETPQIDSEAFARVSRRLTDYFSWADEPAVTTRLYVARKRTRLRRIVNEDEVEAVFRQFGFVIAEMENLGLGDQIRLMRSVAVLAGGHGSGLTNMAFMPSGGVVLELRQEHGSPPCYRNLAVISGQRWQAVYCAPKDSSMHPHAADIIVDANALQRTLEALCR